MADPIRIIIGQRGFVFVGRVRREEHDIVVSGARAIIRWGTKAGLGELKRGPTGDTKLGDPATVRLHPLQVIAQQDVDQDAWGKHVD
jgi:hypothetical protein